MKASKLTFALVLALAASLVAFGAGFASLGCARTVDVVTALAGSFGAGASVAALFVRRARGIPPALPVSG